MYWPLMLMFGEIHRADKSTTSGYVCVFRRRKKSGGGFRQTSRLQWWWPMTLRWRLSRSCVHSGDSCRRSKIAMQNCLQTWRPCRESGTISVMSLLSSPVPPTPAPLINAEDLGYFPRESPSPRIMYSQ